MPRKSLFFKICLSVLLAAIAFPAWSAMSDEAFVKLCSNVSVNEYQTALYIAEEHLRQDTAKLLKDTMRKR